MKAASDQITQGADSLYVEDVWVQLKNAIETGISKCVPVKTIGTKRSLPWLTKLIKKIHIRDKLYNKVQKDR